MNHKSTIRLLCFALLLAISAGLVFAETLEVPIVVSPNVVNVGSAGTWVTVHAEIPYASVETEGVTVLLGGIPVEVTKSDARGDLVAKFLLDNVIGILVSNEVNVLTLSGFTKDGAPFSGTDAIFVIDKKR